MREKFGVQTLRLVKGYLKDMHQQQRGALIGLDQGLASTTDDVHLAQALWRNLWGGGGFEGDVAGVKRKIRGIDRTMKGEDPSEEGAPEMALDQSLLHSTDGSAPSSNDPLAAQHPELAYPQQLARLTLYVRREVRRLGQISDQDIMAGNLGSPESSTVFGDV
jgi:cytochrome b pre-mRNA-processing protein 3